MASEIIQTIPRLTPLADVLATIDNRVRPVAQRTIDIAAAAGRTLAADASAPTRPGVPIAMVDGWALAADDTLGAGGYTPALLLRTPHRIESGQPMPPDTDSVAPFDAVRVSNGQAEALATIDPGDGVLPAGGDCEPGMPLRRAGERLGALDIAAFAAAGLARITVREPRIRVLPLRGSTIINATARLLVADIERRGGAARLDEGGRDLGTVLAAESADAIVVIGGTGSGRSDTSVLRLARDGEVAVHGIAMTPGNTAAVGFVAHRPVLLLPGRLDAALAVWLLVGRRMLERLAGVINRESDAIEAMPLARKVTSTVGLTELVPVRRTGGQAEPLGRSYLPLSSLTRSDGWIVVPPDSEGYSAGTLVQVKPWP